MSLGQTEVRCCCLTVRASWGFFRVKEYCIMRGLSWGNSQASQVSSEMEYYEELLRYSKSHFRVRMQ